MGRKKSTSEEQATLIDVDHPDAKALKRLARTYKSHQRERIAALAQEKDAKDKILAIMHAANLTEFKCDDMTITIVPANEKVKVKFADEDEKESDDDE